MGSRFKTVEVGRCLKKEEVTTCRSRGREKTFFEGICDLFCKIEDKSICR